MAEGGLSGPRQGNAAGAGILRHAAATTVAVIIIIAISMSARRVSTGSHRIEDTDEIYTKTTSVKREIR